MARVKRPSGALPGRLRIVAGKWRRRLLPVVDEPGLRPTSDRVRETLFNWLAPAAEGAHCLDLFAGTGALGIEALSRGAARVVFVERSGRAADALRGTLTRLDAENAEVLERDAVDYLNGPVSKPFDIVFLDPPFDTELLEKSCRLLREKGWLSPHARVYIEWRKTRARPTLPEGWIVIHEKAAGNVRYALVSTAN